MKERYLRLMEKALAAYSNDMIDDYFARVQREGLTEHGFARLTADIGVLIAHGRRTDLAPRFLAMMDFCCAAMPHCEEALLMGCCAIWALTNPAALPERKRRVRPAFQTSEKREA